LLGCLSGEVRIAPFGIAMLHELADLLASLSEQQAVRVERVEVVVPLTRGSGQRVRELVLAGPPFDPGSHGLRRHDVFLLRQVPSGTDVLKSGSVRAIRVVPSDGGSTHPTLRSARAPILPAKRRRWPGPTLTVGRAERWTQVMAHEVDDYLVRLDPPPRPRLAAPRRRGQ